MKVYKDLFERIISPENLFSAWDAFKGDKRNKPYVQRFEWDVEKNIFELYRELKNKTYKHGPYTGFYIQDPKQRHIHKALVRDRVLHHATFSIINPVFEPTFISASFSCRIGYGTHKGVEVFAKMARKTQKRVGACFVLKCDIKKFFDSINHDILLSILKKRVKDNDAVWLLKEIIGSYTSSHSTLFESKGMPIGNLTSQLFANIYMNEFDQFIKHNLKLKFYARYTDDFVIVSHDRNQLEKLIKPIQTFLKQKLALELHPKKVGIRKFSQGIDFLGYIVLLYHKQLRTKTKKRIFNRLRRRIREYKQEFIPRKTIDQSLQSYLGVLSHANVYGLGQQLKNQFWFWLND